MNIVLFATIIVLILLIMMMVMKRNGCNAHSVYVAEGVEGTADVTSATGTTGGLVSPPVQLPTKNSVPVNVAALVKSVMDAEKINTTTVDNVDGSELSYEQRRKAEDAKRMQPAFATIAKVAEAPSVGVDVITNRRGKTLDSYKKMDRDQYKKYLINMRAERLRKLEEYRKRRMEAGKFIPRTKLINAPAKVEGLADGDNAGSCGDCAAIKFGPEWWHLTGAPQADYINRGWYRL